MTAISKVNSKSLSQATRNKNRVASRKLTSSAIAGQRSFSRKLSKTSSDCTTNTESTAATEQEEVCVRFSERTYVRKTLSKKDYTSQEVQACWYTSEENRRIHKRRRKEVRKIDEGNKLKDKKYCSRGLEGLTTVGAATKWSKRSLATNAVLDEQMIQWEEGVFDEDAIAEIYCKAVSSCQLWATIVGRRDHRETEAYSASTNASEEEEEEAASHLVSLSDPTGTGSMSLPVVPVGYQVHFCTAGGRRDGLQAEEVVTDASVPP